MTDILIATNSHDWPTIEPVAAYAHRTGYDPIVYESDKVLAGQKQLSISLTQEKEGPVAIYDGRTITGESIGAAWYRRPATFNGGPPSQIAQLQVLANTIPVLGAPLGKAYVAHELNELQIQGETIQLQKGLWSMVPDERWLNAPARIQAAENKLAQLALAKKVGFEVPDTIISNDWEDIRTTLHPPIVAKMPTGRLYDSRGGIKIMYSTVFDEAKLDKQAAHAPYPGIYQEYVPKDHEWRVTVVGDEVFAGGVATSDEAKDDWRRLQMKPEHVQFYAPEKSLDGAIQEKCIQYLGHLGLHYGAFDLVERPDGHIIFLEMNPNGQFMWLERQLGLPISQAIGAWLVKKCGRH